MQQHNDCNKQIKRNVVRPKIGVFQIENKSLKVELKEKNQCVRDLTEHTTRLFSANCVLINKKNRLQCENNKFMQDINYKDKSHNDISHIILSFFIKRRDFKIFLNILESYHSYDFQ